MRVALLACLLALLAAGEVPRLDPALQRVDLGPADSAVLTLRVHADPGGQVIAVATDCACLAVLTPMPLRLDADGAGELRLRAAGVRPGVELVQAATTRGIVQAHVQIVGPGAGEGLPALRAALALAARERLAVLAIVHDLAGEVRNCGCSQGSLGGADLLAGLPALAGELAPAVPRRFVLTGTVDGAEPGLGAALAEHGWSVGDAAVAVAADPRPLLTREGIQVVVASGAEPVQHARILRPALPRGLAVDVLLLDAAGRPRQRVVVPVDRTLRAVPALAARFPGRLSRAIAADANPSQGCATCHPSAYAAWLASRHARALDSLAPGDRTDACIGCHVTPLTATTVAPAVHCQSCHQGTDAHAAAAGRLPTTGTVDCRGCHDAKHHPAFRRDLAWPVVQHGRETQPQSTP